MEIRHARSEEADRFPEQRNAGRTGQKQIREDSGVGIKPMSPSGTKRLVRRAIQHALANKKRTS